MASSTFPNDITPPIAQTKKRGRPRFVARSTAEKVQERAQRLYSRQLDGQTTRQLVIEHSKIEGISETTAWQDWDKVNIGILKIGIKIEKICYLAFKQ